jgi:hypothetical protein
MGPKSNMQPCRFLVETVATTRSLTNTYEGKYLVRDKIGGSRFRVAHREDAEGAE